MLFVLKSLTFATLLLTVSSLPCTDKNSCSTSLPVCIIGAGPAGLSAAVRLKDKGIKTVIFDRQAEVGGKCQSWYDENDIFHPLGAAFFSNATYVETLKILNQTKVSAEPFALAGARQMYRYNYTNGNIDANPPLPAQFSAALSAEIPRYIAIWTQRFAPISIANFKNGVPDEFTVPAVEWFHQNNFTALPIVLVNPTALYGYGDINKVPALYILQYFAPDIMTAFIGLHNVYYMDFHKMFVEWTKLQLSTVSIRTSMDIQRVDRSGANPLVYYKRSDGRSPLVYQRCSSVIFAFPPNLDNLARTGVKLSDSEKKLFGNVTTNQYYSAAIKINLPFGVSYVANSTAANMPPPNDGEPVAILRLSERSNVSVAWLWGPDKLQDESTTRKLLIDSMSKINKDPRDAAAASQAFTQKDIKAFRKWDYFPHFETAALRGGAYAQLNTLQGQQKTYWASGLSGMEIVEWAVRGGQAVVDTYF